MENKEHGEKVSLSVNIAGLGLKTPLMLAAGIMGISSSSLLRVYREGAGAVVTKSVGLHPRDGYANPTIVDLDFGMLNAMGLPNPGVLEFSSEVSEAKARGAKVIGSIFGSSPDELMILAEKMGESGCDALEINLSCPHVKGAGMQVGQDPQIVQAIVKSVKSVANIPVFTKLTPNVSDIATIAKAAEDGGSDGITAINTLRAMAIDVETGRPILANKIGGLSGPAIKPVAVRCVYEIYQNVSIPVIGVGGISSWNDAVEFMLAGASAVQVGTAIAHRGLGIFKEIADGIEAFMARKGFENVRAFIGSSHKS